MFEKMNILSRYPMKILCFLGRNYMEKYHTRELVRRLNMGLGTASKCLKILEEEELLTKESLGRLSLYQANMENPLLKELKIVFTLMEIDGLIKTLKKVSSRIILFGSCADGEDLEQSDIDILILTEDAKSVNKLLDEYKIQRKVSAVIMDDAEFRNLKKKDKPFYSRIMKGRLLYEVPV